MAVFRLTPTSPEGHLAGTLKPSMKYGSLPGISKPISRLVQGTVMINSKEKDASFALLDGIFELGCNCFDTANIYGGGDNERTVGEWIRTRKLRDSVVVLGKGAHPKDGVERCNPKHIAEDIEESLSRFGFEQIDLYVLHRDDPKVPADEIIDALNHHRQKGDILAFGGSNWKHARLEEANSFAAKKGLTPFVVSSPQYGLAWPQREVWEGCVTIGGPDGLEARDWYKMHPEVSLFPWSSLGGGIFSGRFSRSNVDSFTSYMDKLCVDCYAHEENFKRLDRATELGRELGVTAAQVALAWLLHQEGNIHPLVGCGTVEEFKLNLEALQLKLTLEQRQHLVNG